MKIFLNQEDKGTFFLVLGPNDNIWIKRSDLDALGLRKGLGKDISFAKETYVDLDSIAGLQYRIDEKDVTVVLTAAPGLFAKQTIDSSYATPYRVTHTGGAAAFLNYALLYSSDTVDEYVDVSGELGVSAGDFLGLSTFAYTGADDSDDLTRLMTNVTYNDRDKLQTIIIGDFSGSSGTLGSRPLLGGINISKNFAIDPYLVQYPSLDLSGILETPSDIEIYLDGFLLRKERLAPGEFRFTDIPATVGLGNANIVITDAFGREKIISTPYYYTERLLRKGLQEYSYSLGFRRDDFGEKSFAYSKPAFLGFHSYGFTNRVTAGYIVEASSELINFGPTASLLVAEMGTIDSGIALSRSAGETGVSCFWGYSFKTRKMNIRASLRANSRKYANLTLAHTDDKPRLEFNGAVGFSARQIGSFSVGYSYSDMYEEDRATQIFISFNRSLTKNMTFFVIGSETVNAVAEKEIFMGLHVYFGRGVTCSLNYLRQDGNDRNMVRLQKNLPTGSGFGFSVQAENFHKQDDIESIIQYQNNFGLYEAGFFRREDVDTYRLSATGGIGYIDNSIFFSRSVSDSFAKVKVDGLEGVRVYYFNNEIGRTDKKGTVIIPGLQSFRDNRIDINGNDIPLNYSFPELTKYISPAYRSGSVVEFEVRKLQAVTGTVALTGVGALTQAGSAAMYIETRDKIIEGLVGNDGEFYLENIPPGKHPGYIRSKEYSCTFNIDVPDKEGLFIDVGEVICE